MFKPKLYIHVGRATHFLRWELPEFKKHFTIVHRPNKNIPLLSFGPDILREASLLPASKRFAVLFPGFGHNPVYNDDLRVSQLKILNQKFDHVFINKGPLEIAYKDFDKKKLSFYPFSVDTSLFRDYRPRKAIQSLIHVSNDAPQKDWKRSEKIMQMTGLNYEVYPPRISSKMSHSPSRKRSLLSILEKKNRLPDGYVDHALIVKKYAEYDGFVHVARDIKDRVHIDGKYTASLIEAGLSGAILFWHDTFGLGNDLKTVFDLPLDPHEAAVKITEISNSLDVEKHSMKTRQEMFETFNPANSVGVRAKKIKEILNA